MTEEYTQELPEDLQGKYKCYECGKPSDRYFPLIEKACCSEECAIIFIREYDAFIRTGNMRYDADEQGLNCNRGMSR